MRIVARLLATLLVAAPVAVLAQGMDVPTGPAGPATPPGAAPEGGGAAPVKSGGYFGFSFGTGKGTLYNGGSSLDIDDFLGASGLTPTTLNLQLRMGWGQGDFLFGTQLNLTRSWIESGGVSAGLQFMAVDVVATWWDPSIGIYARCGVGPALYSTWVGDSTSDSYGGVELMLGFGFTMGGLGVGMDLFRQTYDAGETGFDSVTYLLATLSLDMY